MTQNSGIKTPVTFQEIKTRIIDEEILIACRKNGDKLPPVRQLADNFGTNQVTVIRAITELVGEGKLYTLEKKGVYVKDTARCRAAAVRNPIVAAILPAIGPSGYYFNTVLRGIETALGSDYRLLVQDLRWSARDIDSFLDDYTGFYRASGIIVRVPEVYAHPGRLASLCDAGTAIVVIDSTLENISVDRVLVDNFHGGRLAANHLIEHGHTHLAFIRDALPETSGRTVIENERLRGFRSAIEEHGLVFEPSYDVTLNEPVDTYDGTEIIELIRNGVTGLFGYNDHNTTHIIRHLVRHGIRIPQDVSIIGFDNIRMENAAHVILTSIDPYKERMAEKAVAMLLEQMRHPEKRFARCEILTPELVIGESVRRPG